MRACGGIAVMVLCLLAGVAPAGANPVFDLGSFVPTSINGRQVIGGGIIDPLNDTAPPRAGVWVNGTLKRLAEPAGTTASEVSGLSADGRISGAVQGLGGVHAVYWESPTDPVSHQLGPFATLTEDYSTTSGVDAAGQIAGTTIETDGRNTGFLATPGSGVVRVGSADRGTGVTSTVGVTPDGSGFLGRVGGTANNGAADGWYLWPGPGAAGTKLDITPVLHGSFILGGSISALYGNDLASDGTLLGYKDAATRTFWLRLPGGSETPVLGLVGHNAVNARHVVAGTIATTDGDGNTIPHAAIWKPDGTVVDLNTLLPPGSGMVLVDALAINDNGDIAGIAGNATGEVGFLMPAGYVVDSTGDQADSAPGDGNCLTAQTTCTLRAALQEVAGDTSTAPTSVTFNLPGNATTITPGSPLPAVTQPVAIDGAGNPGGRVVLDGAGAGSGAAGLRIEGDGSRVRNLAVQHFDGPGIRVQASKTAIGGLPSDTPACPNPCNVIAANGGPGIVVAGAGSKADLLRGNRLTGNASPAIDLGGGGRTPNDKSDADTGPNTLHNFPIGVLGSTDPVTGERKVSGVSSPDDAGMTVDVYAQSTVTPARGAEPQDYVASGKVTTSGGWIVDLPAGFPAGERFFSATVSDAIDGTSELSPVCGDPDGDGNPDTDGDGLCDDWELHGIDANDDGVVDLPLQDATYGADPSHKDLYLEIDAMKDNAQNTYAPQAGAISHVVDAFAAAPVSNPDNRLGVSLHVNPGLGTVDDTVPEDTAMSGGGRGPGSLSYLREGDLAAPCDGFFGTATQRAAPNCFERLTARALAFRYALFAYRFSEAPDSSGLALGIGGATMTVTLGHWDDAGVITNGGGIARCLTADGCRRLLDESTLMHELGHLLGLRHGGRDHVRYKPNYLSVMNYMYQFPGRVPSRPLDYSRYALPSLDESALVDADGVLAGVDAVTRGDIVARWPRIGWFLGTGPASCSLRSADTAGAVDWDGSLVTLSASTVLHSRECQGAASTLASTKDWPDLRYSFRDQPGVLVTPAVTGDGSGDNDELTQEETLEIAARADTDANGVNDLADACRMVPGAGYADANGNGFADVCEAAMTRLLAFPGQAGGAGGGPAGGPAKDTTAPTLSRLTAKPAVARRARGKKKAVPATLRFTVSEASVVTFTGERVVKGRRAGKRCVAGAKKGRKCTAYVKTGGSLRVSAKPGSNTATFTAKLGTRKLGPGTYRLTAVAIDAAGNRSTPAVVTVTVR